jgi:hypothetical protein
MTDQSSELAHRPEGGGAVVERSDSANFLQLILDAARDPTVDAAKVETMANLAIKLQDRERETQFNQDLNAALMEMPRITKRGEILNRANQVQSRYSRFEDMDLAVRPVLSRHNLAIRFDLGNDGGMVTARAIISHQNGFTWRSEPLKMPMDDSGSKNKTQGMGSAASYAKRHAMKAALNIVEDGEDVDGQGSLPDDLLNDRQARILAHAERAVEAGNYQEWFDALDTLDRSWLVLSGRHAEFGGGPVAMLPPTGRRTSSPRSASPAARGPEPEATEPQDGGGQPKPTAAGAAGTEEPKQKITPREWVDRFKSDVGKCGQMDTLDIYMDGKRDALARLKQQEPALWEEADEAYKAQLATLLEA